jgi:hypothetical protein
MHHSFVGHLLHAACAALGWPSIPTFFLAHHIMLEIMLALHYPGGYPLDLGNPAGCGSGGVLYPAGVGGQVVQAGRRARCGYGGAKPGPEHGRSL